MEVVVLLCKLLAGCVWLASLIWAWAMLDYTAIMRTWGTNDLDRRWHRVRWVIKAASVLLLGAAFAVWAGRNSEHVYRLLIGFLHFSAWAWWLGFDMALNENRGLDPFYTGRTAMMDRFILWVRSCIRSVPYRLIEQGTRYEELALRLSFMATADAKVAHLTLKLPGLLVSLFVLIYILFE